MPTIVEVYVGAVAPTGITVIIDPPTIGNDNILQTCSAVSLEVKPPTGPNVFWGAAIISRNPLTVQYQFNSGDVDTLGIYKTVPRLTVQGGTIDAEVFHLSVINPYA